MSGGSGNAGSSDKHPAPPAVTQTAGFLSVVHNYLPMAKSSDPGKAFQGGLNAFLTLTMMVCMALVLVEAALRWRRAWRGRGETRGGEAKVA